MLGQHVILVWCELPEFGLYLASELSPALGILPKWQASVLSSHTHPVTITDPLQTESITFTSPEDGRLRVKIGERRIAKLSEEEWFRHRVESLLKLCIDPPLNSVELPVFIASDPTLRPYAVNVVVHLYATKFGDLPHYTIVLESQIESAQRIRDQWRQLLSETGYSSALPDKVVPSPSPNGASQLAIPMGLRLPIEVTSAGKIVGGVLRLGKNLEAGTYRAKLHLSDQADDLTIGTVLSWGAATANGRREQMPVARINQLLEDWQKE